MGHEPILKTAKRIVEANCFLEEGKVFIIRLFYSYMSHSSSLIKRSATEAGANAPENPPDIMANRCRFLIGNEAMEQEQGEIPNFYELYL